MNKVLLFFLLVVALVFLIFFNSKTEKEGLEYPEILDKGLSGEEQGAIQGNNDGGEPEESEEQEGSSAPIYGGSSSEEQIEDKSGGGTIKQLSEFQKTACEAADEGNTCDTKLKKLAIVKKGDCCESLGLCCD